jgi:hypothetical protein
MIPIRVTTACCLCSRRAGECRSRRGIRHRRRLTEQEKAEDPFRVVSGGPAMECRPEADGEPSGTRSTRPRNGLAAEHMADDEKVTNEEDGGNREGCGKILCVGRCRRSCPVRWSPGADAADVLCRDQKVPGGANWLPPAAPVAQGANS